MKTHVRETEPVEEPTEDDEASAPVAYRVAGDVQVRAAEAEQQVAEMKREMRALEHEVYAARERRLSRPSTPAHRVLITIATTAGQALARDVSCPT
jgi:hypothetical protein